ncbi:MAG: glutathione peroxidase [Clostridiales bacterium]|nr:glutathione peroxidase [Clostridiales bacterium]
MNIYDFSVLNLEGESVSLQNYQDKVILIINSATQCGFTPQYDELQDMYEKYQEQGFVILDFPCNQFGNQAPGSNHEIAAFCDSRYGISFPIFSKIEVNGEGADPLYQYLVEQKGFKGLDEEHPLTAILNSMLEREHPDYKEKPDIKWNFTKFLIDRSGNVIERFEPTTDMGYVEAKVRELL